MSIDACAALVARSDPDRFAAVMAMPLALRAKMLVLYAFNLEVARAPWASKEPLICEMRLQWWRDIVAEPKPRAHEVAAPLHALIHEHQLPLPVFDQLIAARSWDIYTDPFVDDLALDMYLDHSAGGLMWLAALLAGAGPSAEPAVRGFGHAVGLAAYLRAVPELEQRGKRPLVDGRPDAVRALASHGLAQLAAARKERRLVGEAGRALLVGWQAEGILRQVVENPLRVAQGELGLSEFHKRGGLLMATLLGRW
ncbi:MAG: squalene/phytoene synthase family protein [Microgenomates group bacterium]|jgi:hypothetical protein